MRNSLLVARRELLANVRTKGFWLGVILNPTILIAMIVVPILFSRASSERRFAVVDRSGWLLAAVEGRAAHEDAEKLLQQLVAAPPQGADAVAWPQFLIAAAAPLGGATEAQIRAAAGPLAGSQDYQAWWRALTPDHARSLLGELSRAKFLRVEAPEGDPESTLRSWLERGGDWLFAYFVIGADPLAGSEENKYVSSNLTDEDLREWFTRLAAEVVRERRYEQEGVGPEQRQRIERPVEFASRTLGKSGQEQQVSAIDTLKQWAPVGFSYLLWISVFATASMLMTGVIEEKQGKLIEVLLSSTSPRDLMIGKLLGIAATGMLLVAGWAVIYFVVFLVLPRVMSALATTDFTVILREPLYLISFLVYFVLGYLLYAAILLSIGSLASSNQDAQNMMGPVMVVLLIPLLTLMPVGKDPNGSLARILSYIPPFTPFVMMNRAGGPPAWWEYVITTLLLIGSVIFCLWAAGKIFRLGILMTGKPPKPREIWRLLKAA